MTQDNNKQEETRYCERGEAESEVWFVQVKESQTGGERVRACEWKRQKNQQKMENRPTVTAAERQMMVDSKIEIWDRSESLWKRQRTRDQISERAKDASVNETEDLGEWWKCQRRNKIEFLNRVREMTRAFRLKPQIRFNMGLHSHQHLSGKNMSESHGGKSIMVCVSCRTEADPTGSRRRDADFAF